MTWSSKSTLIGWAHLYRSGWLDPFPYKLYDSNEILSVNISRPELLDFSNLAKINIVEHTFAYERYPSIKAFFRRILGWIGIKWHRLHPRDKEYPIRWVLEEVQLGKIPEGSTKRITNLMPSAVLSAREAAEIRADSLKLRADLVRARASSSGPLPALGPQRTEATCQVAQVQAEKP